MKQYDTVVIGTSAGGLGALTAILAVLPENFKLPILVVQHQPADADDFLHRHLNDLCQLNVKEASPGELIVAGKV
ncbi:MAG: chemotaxis response regulator protein-glutamate methylesterase, partial [Pseudomonadales bacterium]|nr:chemotaxis response regulator protein-glutamate methylesterase [Pseudomonadales bacterium]